jgi:superfamily II DNA or RNA helicase
MTYVLLPPGRQARTPWRRVDSGAMRQWTVQPGGEGVLAISVQKYDGPLDEQPRVVRPAQAPVILPDGKLSGVVQLRDYQVECVQAVARAWAEGMQAPLVVLPTGAGKTIIASYMMDYYFHNHGQRALFLAHRKELVRQTAEKALLVTSGRSVMLPSVGIMLGSKNDLRRDITIASVQTLGSTQGSRLSLYMLSANGGAPDVLILDEAHHAVSPQWRRVIGSIRDANPRVKIVGMTATPGRADGTALDTVFDGVVFERNLIDMIRDGYLVPPKGYRVPLRVDLDSVKTDGGDYQQKSLGKIMNTPPVNQAVIEAWRAYGHNRKTVVFAVDVAHAVALKEEFNDAGYAAEHVADKMGARERDAVFKRFRAGETQILVNVEIATEGFDDSSIEAILMARPTQSQALYIQCMGRGLRPHPGKTECIVIDCVGNSERHSPVQLATLAGFGVAAPAAGGGNGGDGEDDETVMDEPAPNAELQVGLTVEFDITNEQHRSRYKWRETSMGWVMAIPRVGYYLVAWESTAHARCTIRFYDQREGRRNQPPVQVLKDPVPFEMAYGLVESEMDRLFAARSRRNMRRTTEGGVFEVDDPGDRHTGPFPDVNFVDLEEGTDESLDVPETLLLSGAGWRTKPATDRQRELLLKLGAKEKGLPDKAGEASDMITILRVEREMRMRVPPTPKQLGYLIRHGLPPASTKGEAARAIWQHRKATVGP